MTGDRDELLEALRSLEAEGWFAAWSDDPRVQTIREAIKPAEWPAPAEVDPNQTEIPTPIPPDYWETAQ